MGKNFETGGGLPEDGIDEVINASKDYLQKKKLDEEIIGNVNHSPEDAIILSRGYMDRVEELMTKSFSEANDLTELCAIIASKGEDITMANTSYSAGEVISIIKRIKTGDAELKNLTRTDGLRDKVAELLKKQ